MKNPKKKGIRLNIITDVKYLKGKRDKHGCENLAFVFYGVYWTPRKVSTVYRKRFAIESSYKMRNIVKPKTSTKDVTFRFLVDLAVIKLIDSKKMDNKDFIRTENYSLRLKPSGAKKVTEKFNKWTNKKVSYQGKSIIWSYALLLKTRELAHYLVEKKKSIDFSKPNYAVERQDSEDIRQKILSISYSDWGKLGFSKGTLHYMKQNAKDNKPFTLNKHVRERLEMWSGC